MSKKTRTVSNKAGKLMKCDGQMLKKVIEAKGYKLYELSKMLRYCSDYLTTCCRTNKISDVAAKYLMDYKIFPQMYDLEGEIETEDIVSPTEVKINKDDNQIVKDIFDTMHDAAMSKAAEELKAETDKAMRQAADKLKKRMDFLNRNAIYGIDKPEEIAFYTEYGVVRSEKDLRNCIKQALNHENHPYLATNLIAVRNILEKACVNGLSYDIRDMRNDLLVYATHVGTYPEKWVEFVNNLKVLYYAGKSDYSKDDCPVQEIKKVLNAKSGMLEKGFDVGEGGYGPAPKNPSYYAAGHTIAKGLFQLMRAAMDDLKHDPEFKEMIKQAVKEAYEEL